MASLPALPHELLEKILLDFRAGELFDCLSVCRRVRAVIISSLTLRRKLFLTDSPPTNTEGDTTTPRVNPFLDDSGPWYTTNKFIHHRDQENRTAECYDFHIMLDVDAQELDIFILYGRAPWALRAGARKPLALLASDLQMKMLLSQPSLPATVTIHGEKVGRVAAGATFEEVVKLFWVYDVVAKERSKASRREREEVYLWA